MKQAAPLPADCFVNITEVTYSTGMRQVAPPQPTDLWKSHESSHIFYISQSHKSHTRTGINKPPPHATNFVYIIEVTYSTGMKKSAPP